MLYNRAEHSRGFFTDLFSNKGTEDGVVVRPLSPTYVWPGFDAGPVTYVSLLLVLFSPSSSVFLVPQKPIKHLQIPIRPGYSTRTRPKLRYGILTKYFDLFMNNAIKPSIVNRTQLNCISIEIELTHFF